VHQGDNVSSQFDFHTCHGGYLRILARSRERCTCTNNATCVFPMTDCKCDTIQRKRQCQCRPLALSRDTVTSCRPAYHKEHVRLTHKPCDSLWQKGCCVNRPIVRLNLSLSPPPPSLSHTHTRAYTHTRTHTHTRAHTCTHTHTHTHTDQCWKPGRTRFKLHRHFII